MSCHFPLMLVQPDQILSRDRDRPVFCEGDTPGPLYRVEGGCVRLQKSSACGQRQIMAFRHPGDLFGLGTFGPGTVDAEAVCPTVVSRLSQARLLRILQSDPDVGLAILASAHGGDDTTAELLGLVCHANSGKRLSWFLNGLVRRFGQAQGRGFSLDLPMMRLDIADHLGMTFETVSRELTKLRKARVIALAGPRQLIVLRPRLLAALAEAD